MKKFLSVLVVLILTMFTGSYVFADSPSASISGLFLGQYILRGIQQDVLVKGSNLRVNDFQPSITINDNNFTANIIENYGGFNTGEQNEVDYNLSYLWAINKVKVSAGFWNYNFPLAQSIQYPIKFYTELYIGASYDIPVNISYFNGNSISGTASPIINVYYDTVLKKISYAEFTLGIFTLGYNFGWEEMQIGDKSNVIGFTTLKVNIGYDFKYNNWVITPSIIGQLALNKNNYINLITGNLNIVYNF